MKVNRFYKGRSPGGRKAKIIIINVQEYCIRGVREVNQGFRLLAHFLAQFIGADLVPIDFGARDGERPAEGLESGLSHCVV